MDHLFVGYLQDPTPENFLALREALLETPEFDPYCRDLGRVDGLFAAHQFAAAEQELRQRMRPNHLLSAGAHLKLALIYQKLGRADEMERERSIAIRCIEGILSTGDGSLERPYRVTRTSDEYDVLAASNLKWGSQTLRQVDGRRIDVVRTREGKELCFDVSDIFDLLKRRLRNGEKSAHGD
jgi:hypothetical protein